MHTAVKIAPNSEGPVIYVPDASRSVGVATSLMSDQSDAYLAELAEEYEDVRRRHANRKATPILPLAEARASRPQIDWDSYTPPRPKFIGRRTFKSYDLAEIAKYVDWGPFFQTWSLFGPFPAILDDKVVGEQARKVYADGQAMMKRIVEGRWLTANGVVGFYPANSVNDEDIEVYKDESRSEVLFTYRNLRQQGAKREGVSNKSLSDFIAPKSSGKLDYIGMFAVTAGLGIEKKEAEFEKALDDYSSIMLKSLADRLAEAFAECLHARVRQDLWGYAADEALSNDDMIAEKYVGIRPAPGYPACPEHVVKTDMFRVLDGADIGMMLSHVPGLERVGLLLQPSAVAVLQRRHHRRRPVAGLRRAQRPQHRGPQAHPGAEPGLRRPAPPRRARPAFQRHPSAAPARPARRFVLFGRFTKWIVVNHDATNW